MNYDPVPWDATKTGKDRVKAIKAFIVTDQSSWDDSGKERAIWNGAKKADHQSAGANGQGSTAPPPPPPPPPTPPKAACKVLQQGLGAGKWEVKGGGWGNDGGAKLSNDIKSGGAESFQFTPGGTDGFEWAATFVSEKSVTDIQNIINSDAGGGVAVKCTT